MWNAPTYLDFESGYKRKITRQSAAVDFSSVDVAL